jgi:hypothetical protein
MPAHKSEIGHLAQHILKFGNGRKGVRRLAEFSVLPACHHARRQNSGGDVVHLFFVHRDFPSLESRQPSVASGEGGVTAPSSFAALSQPSPAIRSHKFRMSRVASVGVSPSSDASSARSKMDSSNSRSITFRAASFASESAKHSAADMCGLARTMRRGAIVNCVLKQISPSGVPESAGESLGGSPAPILATEGTISTVTP